MLLSPETLRIIFGLKLRNLRLDKGLSLKELSEQTGLSSSYLNEIEKGKKYPKPEKIAALTKVLGETYDDLISLKLKREFSLVTQLLERGLFQQMPFELFGIPSQSIFELLTEHPKKVRVLIGTCLELARAHGIKVEDFLYATLRSYLDIHQNYFPGIEEKAESLAQSVGFSHTSDSVQLYASLQGWLKQHYSIKVLERDFDALDPALAEASYIWSKEKSMLYLDSRVALHERNWLLARQIGYQVFKVMDQPVHGRQRNFESFDQLFKHFSANYFAGALLIPRGQFIESIHNLFESVTLPTDALAQLVNRFACTPEALVHRMSQILPRHFDLEQLFFLRYDFDSVQKRFEVSRELHLSDLHSPHAVKRQEHYCARWMTHKLANALIEHPRDLLVGTQRSQFFGTTNEYLIFTLAFRKSDRVDDMGSVSLGILLNDAAKSTIRFLNDAKIRTVTVSETCERCALKECEDRLAPLNPRLGPFRSQSLKTAVARVLAE